MCKFHLKERKNSIFDEQTEQERVLDFFLKVKKILVASLRTKYLARGMVWVKYMVVVTTQNSNL